MVAESRRQRRPSKCASPAFGRTFVQQLREAIRQILPEPRPVVVYRPPSEYVDKVEDGKVYWADGMSEGYEPNLFTKVYTAATLGLYIGIPQIILCLVVASIWSSWARALLSIVVGSAFLPLRPLFSRRVMNCYTFLCWRRYFKYSYVFDKSLAPYDDFVIAQFPHGAFPLGTLVGGSFMATEFPEYTCYALAANNSFLVPIWRHVHTWMGTMAATEKNFRRLLALGTGSGLRAAARETAAANAAIAAGREISASKSCQSRSTSQDGGSDDGSSATSARTSESSGGPNRGTSAAGPAASAPASPPNSKAQAVPQGSGTTAHSSLPGVASPAKTLLSAAAALRARISGGGDGKPRTRLRKFNQQGVSVGVIPGGIAEMYLQHPDFERIKLLDRKGFVRIAIEHGADLLPVYMFGASKMMNFGPPWLMNAARKLRMSIGVLYGLWGTTIPRPIPMRMAVGIPVSVQPAMQRTDPRFEKHVEKVHKDFVAAIRKVYYEHREAYGWGDRELVIV